jgi:hypothetical protein
MSDHDLVHDQWSTCEAFVENESGILILGGATGVASSDITGGSISKEIHHPTGGFSLTLQPSQNYLSRIKVNDWITIKINDGTSAGTTAAMYGLVDRVALRTVVDGRGAEKDVIQVVGRDWGKVLSSTSLVYDPALGGSFVTEGAIKAFATWNRANPDRVIAMPPEQAVAFFLEHFLYERRQFALPGQKRWNSWLKLDSTKASAAAGYIPGLQNLNVSGSLWNLLMTYSVPLLNEMFTDWTDEGPILRLREYPFSRSAFSALESIKVPATKVISKDFGKSDADVCNWFRVFTESEPGLTIANQIGYGAPASMGKHGLRRMEETTNGLFPLPRATRAQQESVGSDQLEAATRKIVEWHASNENFYSGTITTPLRVAAKVGMRLDYENREVNDFLSFYIESVNHQFSYALRGQGSTTTMQVTRGTPSHFGDLKTFGERLEAEEVILLVDPRMQLWMDLYAFKQPATDPSAPVF